MQALAVVTCIIAVLAAGISLVTMSTVQDLQKTLSGIESNRELHCIWQSKIMLDNCAMTCLNTFVEGYLVDCQINCVKQSSDFANKCMLPKDIIEDNITITDLNITEVNITEEE